MINEREKKLPFYVTGIGTQENQEAINRPMGLFDYQWTLCKSGKGILMIEGVEIEISAGMGFYFSAEMPHRYHAIEEPWEMSWVTFNGNYTVDLIQLLCEKSWGVFSPESMSDAERLFSEINKKLEEDTLDKVIDVTGQFYQLLLTMKNKLNVQTLIPNTSKVEKLKPVIDYMEVNYGSNIALDKLAQLIDVNQHYLCKLFDAAFGTSPINYLIRLRIQIAKSLLLQEPALKISEIANRVCYTDVSYFCSIFKKREHLTPTEFRRSFGKIK
jgi:AraC-like DNA-binding protein